MSTGLYVPEELIIPVGERLDCRVEDAAIRSSWVLYVAGSFSDGACLQYESLHRRSRHVAERTDWSLPHLAVERVGGIGTTPPYSGKESGAGDNEEVVFRHFARYFVHLPVPSERVICSVESLGRVCELAFSLDEISGQLD